MAERATEQSPGERIVRIEGILEQMSLRLDRVERELENLANTKVDKWEVRIWFLILLAFQSAYSGLLYFLLR